MPMSTVLKVSVEPLSPPRCQSCHHHVNAKPRKEQPTPSSYIATRCEHTICAECALNMKGACPTCGSKTTTDDMLWADYEDDRSMSDQLLGINFVRLLADTNVRAFKFLHNQWSWEKEYLETKLESYRVKLADLQKQFDRQQVKNEQEIQRLTLQLDDIVVEKKLRVQVQRDLEKITQLYNDRCRQIVELQNRPDADNQSIRLLSSHHSSSIGGDTRNLPPDDMEPPRNDIPLDPNDEVRTNVSKSDIPISLSQQSHQMRPLAEQRTYPPLTDHRRDSSYGPIHTESSSGQYRSAPYSRRPADSSRQRMTPPNRPLSAYGYSTDGYDTYKMPNYVPTMGNVRSYPTSSMKRPNLPIGATATLSRSNVKNYSTNPIQANVQSKSRSAFVPNYNFNRASAIASGRPVNPPYQRRYPTPRPTPTRR